MSIKAKVAAAVASVGVLGAGWAVGTASGATLSTGDAVTTATTSTTTTSSTTGTTTTSGTTTSGTTTSGTTASASAGSYTDGTYTGTTVTHQFGSVTVTVTISGGKITDVTSNVVSDGQQKSDQINNRSIPTIKARVLAASSAAVSTVSGATYTTKAYLSSLQSALSQAS